MEFQAISIDGTVVHGRADRPDGPTRAAVLFVAGTGTFDRDARFGRSGTERDGLFHDLAARMLRRGLATVRYDKRGVIHAAPGQPEFDRRRLAGVTTTTSRDDLAAVYDWARAPTGLGAGCVILLAHSEGMAHVGRLAETGAPGSTSC